ncbi:ECF transporter S component family protein [Pyxidicoccus xibeiensis]|uniref:hypothetical protein n=1 Tax=Pyxidicoccus xibeiensis TaxID=2906759 RepID=UPI0020A76E58|nr:hypothetical protein [Pyxidicoccus xibeiensis]MCP3142573.1 hypothetical protein [Pyxidicoccus xibeiensis]
MGDTRAAGTDRRERLKGGTVLSGIEVTAHAPAWAWGGALVAIILTAVVLGFNRLCWNRKHPRLVVFVSHLPMSMLIACVWIDMGARWGAPVLGLWLLAHLALCFLHAGWAAMHPRLAAVSWPYLPLFLISGLLWAALATGLVRLTASGVTELESHWTGLALRYPMVQSAAWLYFWLPLLLAYSLIMVAAARFMSRHFFHATLVTLVICAVAAGLLHAEPRPESVPFMAGASMECPFEKHICFALSPPSSEVRTPAPDPEVWPSPQSLGQWVQNTRSGLSPVWWQPLSSEAPISFFPPQSPGDTASTHQPPLLPDTLSLVVLGVSLLLIYRALRSINARQSTMPIEVGPIIDSTPAREGAPAPVPPLAPAQQGDAAQPEQRRPELEQLLRETLQKNALHTPPGVPGGELLYWRELLETQTNDRLSWFTRLIALLMRVAIPPHGLRVTGVVVSREWNGKTTQGLRFSVKNLRTHRVELAETYVEPAETYNEAPNLEAIVERAAYATSELALELCPALPAWTYWHERDGIAVINYWKGVKAFRAQPFHIESFPKEDLRQAREHFEAAAKRCHGNGMVMLQYGQVHEVTEDFACAARIYLDLSEGSPHMPMARFRLARVCSFVDRWLVPHLTTTDTERMATLTGLLHDLRDSRIFQHFHQQDAEDNNWDTLTKEWLEKLPRENDAERVKLLRKCFHRFAMHQFRILARSCFWDVIGWCLCNIAERRRLVRTLLWSPQRLRATHHAMQVAYCCTWLRECLLQAPDVTAKVLKRAASMEPSLRPSRTPPSFGGDVVKARQFWKCFRQVWDLEHEADSAQRRRATGWGMVHYNLACFYALCLMPEMDREFTGIARSDESEAGWRIAPLPTHCDTWAHQATRHLTHAMHDPLGPIAKGTWWWLDKDPDLRALRRTEHYASWREWVQLAGGDPATAVKAQHGRGAWGRLTLRRHIPWRLPSRERPGPAAR